MTEECGNSNIMGTCPRCSGLIVWRNKATCLCEPDQSSKEFYAEVAKLIPEIAKRMRDGK